MGRALFRQAYCAARELSTAQSLKGDRIEFDFGSADWNGDGKNQRSSFSKQSVNSTRNGSQANPYAGSQTAASFDSATRHSAPS